MRWARSIVLLCAACGFSDIKLGTSAVGGQVELQRKSGVVADGSDFAVLGVYVHDEEGQPLRDAAVELRWELLDSGAPIVPKVELILPRTGADGWLWAQVLADPLDGTLLDAPASVRVLVEVVTDLGRLLLLEKPVVTFVGGRADTIDFAVRHELPVGPAPSDVVSADVNGDGILDLLTADSGARSVTVLYGLGSGDFSAARSVALAAEPRALAVADVVGTEAPDLIVASAGTPAVLRLHAGDGRGGFEPTALALTLATTETQATSPKAIVVAPLDGDGRLDLAVLDAGTASVWIYVSADATAAPYRLAGRLETGLAPTALVAAQLVGEAALDLAVANTGSGSVSLFRGEGGGVFVAMQALVAEAPAGLVAVDLDGDDSLDLVSASAQSPSLTVHYGSDTGFHEIAGVPVSLGGTGGRLTAIAGADVNGDGHLDLAVGTAEGSTSSLSYGVALLLGSPYGRSEPIDGVKMLSTSVPASALELADFDGDRLYDLAVAKYAASTVAIVVSGLGQ